MYIKLCDRCGKQTTNKSSFLVPVPVSSAEASLQVDGTWFGESVCLCDDCIEDFNNFRYNHKKYKINFTEEINE